jgi:hypothetical protein
VDIPESGLSALHHIQPTKFKMDRSGSGPAGAALTAEIALGHAVEHNWDMNTDTTAVLKALALMCEQFMTEDGRIDHCCMSAGEKAVEQLIKYRLLEPCPRGGHWTEAGRALLD